MNRASSIPDVDPIVTTKTPPAGKDILTASANNLYVGVTMKDLEGFDERYPLNSRLVKRDGTIVEEVYRVNGRYGSQIAEPSSSTSRDAIPFATEPMAAALRALIEFYTTGETKDREAYDIAWVRDKASPVDTINGFTEVYLDARGIKGAWEALVFYVNSEKTSGIRKIAANAQWFEDRMPWDPKYRKAGVQGITANAIDVVIETGDSGPVTPIGINLPNDQSVREQYGSKSVSLSNVNEAYDKVDPAGVPDRVLLDPGGSGAVGEVGRARRRADDEHARGHRPRVGQGRGAAQRQSAGGAEGAVLRARGSAGRSRSPCISCPIRRLVELGLVAKEDHDESCGRSTRRTRGTRSCSCGACAKGASSRKTTCATAR